MIFFDIDNTLLDNSAAEYLAALEFHQGHADIFPISPHEFAQKWQMITERHVQRYLLKELSFQGQRRARLKKIFSNDRIF